MLPTLALNHPSPSKRTFKEMAIAIMVLDMYKNFSDLVDVSTADLNYNLLISLFGVHTSQLILKFGVHDIQGSHQILTPLPSPSF